MIPSLQTFVRALSTPERSLSKLADARPVQKPGQQPALRRTTYFAETEIVWHGKRWLLSLPLRDDALLRAERTAIAVRRLNSAALTEYRLLPQELHWQDDLGATRCCDLLLQHLPDGYDFEEALLRLRREPLLQALDDLRGELRRIGFAHRNLKASNLRWSAGRFVLLRYHDARIGEGTDDDAEAFDALRRRIEEVTGGELAAAPADGEQPLRFDGHLHVGPLCEGLVCVEDATGYGYVDAQNRPVIASRYLWAADFREGRAEIRTADGMGLIDREGREVIPARYEIVEYDAPRSLLFVRQEGLWARFDLQGNRLTEFLPRDEAFDE
ncbi:MAG: WG repeat-containing protein [Alistipes sp.]|nr:WG repeat-containing protein [Alistipes sp.]